MSTRHSLARVVVNDDGSAELSPSDALVSAVTYSRFKHGDGHASVLLGMRLADLAAREVAPAALASRRLVVTSSGFAVAPPAAHSLVAPFTRRLGGLVGRPVDSPTVLRTHPTLGDYATMPPGARSAAIAGTLRAEPRSFAGAHVIALDDVVVTGIHERAMDRALTEAGAEVITHVYIADGRAYAGRPAVESTLNHTAVATIEDLEILAQQPGFVPNARVTRMILGARDDAIRRFLSTAPPRVLTWLTTVGLRDGLTAAPQHRRGAVVVRRCLAESRAAAVTP